MHRAIVKRVVGLAGAAFLSAASGAAPWSLPVWKIVPSPVALPDDGQAATVKSGDASIWYETFGRGPCVVLLHPGLANSTFWGDQVASLRRAGHEIILIDSRGHGRSALPGPKLNYEIMAQDVVRVLDALHKPRCAVVGWSDGAITGLVLAMRAPDRVSRVFAFGANMDLSGVNPKGDRSETFRRYGQLTAKSYRSVSPTPDAYPSLVAAVNAMWTAEPHYTAAQLSNIKLPVAIVDGEYDEVIRRSHTLYLAHTIPGATLMILPGLSHFAALQNPKQFNRAMLRYLANRNGTSGS